MLVAAKNAPKMHDFVYKSSKMFGGRQFYDPKLPQREGLKRSRKCTQKVFASSLSFIQSLKFARKPMRHQPSKTINQSLNQAINQSIIELQLSAAVRYKSTL